jgi:segregation and condensation protein A
LLEETERLGLAIDHDSKRKIADPPLNLLFNPSLIGKKDVWAIDISKLLEMLLTIIHVSRNKDLRLCGIAAISSSIIYRLKVESIFRLQKVSMQKKALVESGNQEPIVELGAMELPFRFEPTYPVSLEDLLKVLENMMIELSNPYSRRKGITVEPIQLAGFDQYTLKFEQIIRDYEDRIFHIVDTGREVTFRILTRSMDALEIVRYFIAILYLATKGKIILEQTEDSEDFRITTK